MGRANDAGVRVGKQHRTAISGQHPKHQARRSRHQRIGLRPFASVFSRGYVHAGRMNLMHCHQPVRAEVEPAAYQRPVFLDAGAVVLRAETAVKPFGHASGAAEKPVGNPVA